MSETTSHLSTALADRYRIERHLGEGGMATVSRLCKIGRVWTHGPRRWTFGSNNSIFACQGVPTILRE